MGLDRYLLDRQPLPSSMSSGFRPAKKPSRSGSDLSWSMQSTDKVWTGRIGRDVVGQRDRQVDDPARHGPILFIPFEPVSRRIAAPAGP